MTVRELVVDLFAEHLDAVGRPVAAGEPISRLDLLTAQLTPETGGSDAALAARCWDLHGLAVAYRQEIERIRTVLAGPEPDGAAALVTHLRALARVRRVSTGDPILPDALRPPGWPGVELRDAWLQFCAVLAGPARRHVADVLARPTQRSTADLSGQRSPVVPGRPRRPPSRDPQHARRVPTRLTGATSGVAG